MPRAAIGWLRGAASSFAGASRPTRGKKAETLTAKEIMGFVWNSRWELLSFLAWTGRLDREVHKRA